MRFPRIRFQWCRSAFLVGVHRSRYSAELSVFLGVFCVVVS
jgi:hypothetical protein